MYVIQWTGASIRWPANSLDFNPIENIWRDIKFLIRKQPILQKTKAELQKSIIGHRETYPQENCQKLI